MPKSNQTESPVHFIVNPIAGTNHKSGVIDAIRQAFGDREYIIHLTEHCGHASEIAAVLVAEGAENIVAVGGDGTINEVATALIGKESRLGILPVGSGNGLARELKIPVHLADALKVIKNPRERIIDAGEVNGRYFFCTCGTGFDASVGKKFASDSRRGMLSYVRATIHQYISYSPKTYILKTEGKKVKLKAFLVTFANSGQYGNNAYIAPNAEIDDGYLDLCVLRPFPKTSTLDLGLRLFFKNIDQSPYLETMKVKKASLKRKGKKKITLHLDGEPLTFETKLKFRVVPSALKVMVPAMRRKKGLKLPITIPTAKLPSIRKLKPK